VRNQTRVSIAAVGPSWARNRRCRHLVDETTRERRVFAFNCSRKVRYRVANFGFPKIGFLERPTVNAAPDLHRCAEKVCRKS
jgi:hypothetical protein